MKRVVGLLWALCLIFGTAMLPGCAASDSATGQVWNEIKGEKLEALQLKGDPVRGEEAFKVCRGCHKQGATGSASGAYPRLAGQHVTVLIEQISDIRSGVRTNPTMAPFSDAHVLSTQEIADIAVYLQALPIGHLPSGAGPGVALDRGQALYVRDCVACHGERGQGSAKKFIPLVAGQHYGYLLRELHDIRDGRRGNANPDMARQVQAYADDDLSRVADYMSRLTVP